MIRATLSYQDANREVVFKIIKPYVLEALPQELAIVDELAAFIQTQGDFYGLGDVPLADMFQDVKEALSSEIRIEDEQDNLNRAEAFCAGSRVTVPIFIRSQLSGSPSWTSFGAKRSQRHSPEMPQGDVKWPGGSQTP